MANWRDLPPVLCHTWGSRAFIVSLFTVLGEMKQKKKKSESLLFFRYCFIEGAEKLWIVMKFLIVKSVKVSFFIATPFSPPRLNSKNTSQSSISPRNFKRLLTSFIWVFFRVFLLSIEWRSFQGR
jgi:hypothetical protein